MSDSYVELSTVTGQYYDLFKCIRILNIQQVCFYLDKAVPLRDIKQSIDKNGKSVLVFYFYKEDTKNAYNEWCERKNREE